MSQGINQNININVNVNGTDKVENLEKDLNKLNNNNGAKNFEDLFKDTSRYTGDVSDDIENIMDDLESIYGKDFADAFSEWENDLVNANAALHSTSQSATQVTGSMSAFGGTAASALTSIIGISSVVGLITTGIDKLDKEFEGFLDGLKKAAEYGLEIGKTLGGLEVKGIEKWGELLLKISELEFDGLKSGLGSVSDMLEGINSLTQEVIDSLMDLGDEAINVQNDYFTLYKYLGDEAGTKFSSYVDQMIELFGIDGSGLLRSMKGIYNVTSNIGGGAEQVEKYSEALSQFALDLQMFSGESLDTIITQLGTAVNMGVMNSRSALARSLNLTDQQIEAYKKLATQEQRLQFILANGVKIQGTYNQFMGTTAGITMQYKNALANLNSELATFAGGILSVVLPVITQFLNILNVLFSSLNDLFGFSAKSAAANGASGTKGLYDYTNGLEGVSNGIKDVGKSASVSKKQLASFDDVITLDKEDTIADQLDALADFKGFNPSSYSWIDDIGKKLDKTKTKFEEFIEEFARLLKNKEWYKAGGLLASFIDDLLNGIDWKTITAKAEAAGKGIAQFLGGIIDNKNLFKDVGKTLGELTNAINLFMYSFASEMRKNNWFYGLGEDIGLVITGFWDSLDKNLAAENIYEWIMGVLELVQGFIETKALSSSVFNITDIIGRIFKKITSFDSTVQINKTVGGFIDELLDAINGGLDKIEEDKIDEKFLTFIRNVASVIGDRLPAIVETLARLIAENIKVIGGAITNAIVGLFGDLSDSEVQDMGAALGNVFVQIFESLTNILQGILDTNVLPNILTIIHNAFTQLVQGDTLTQLGDTILLLIQQVFQWVGENMPSIIENCTTVLAEGIKLIGEAVGTALYELFSNMDEDDIERISDSIITLLESVFGALNAVAFGLEESGAVEKIVEIVNRVIEKARDHASEWSDVLRKLFEAAIEVLRGIDWDSILRLIEEAVPWDSLFELLGEWLGIKIKFWAEKLAIKIGGFLSKLFGGIVDFTTGGMYSNMQNLVNSSSSSSGGSSARYFIPLAMQARQGDVDWGFDTYNFDIPRLATGGLITRSTIANIGEAGREAVLPLQNNTAWMDDLAGKLADKMNGGNGEAGGNNININLNDVKSGFYTRNDLMNFAEEIVSALKVYGANVSVVG